MSPKLPLLCPCRNPERQTDCRGRPEKESRPRRGTKGSEVIPPGRAKARDGHATTRKAPGRGHVEHRKTLLSELEFRASGSRNPRIPRQCAICYRRARKGPTNAEMRRHPLRGGGDLPRAHRSALVLWRLWR